MDSIKVAEDAAAGTIIKTITPVLANGGAAAAVFEFTDGKFGIDNAKFDITGGILTNNNILASGTYWIRYKVTVGFNSVEKGLKIYTDDKEVAITVSDNEYASDIAIGGTVATVSLSSGSLTDVEITPQSSADDAGAPAFSYDGSTGNIEWTGDQTPVDYSYAIQYTGDCIKPIVVEDFEAVGGPVVDEGFTASFSGHYLSFTWTQIYNGLGLETPADITPVPLTTADVRCSLQYGTSGDRSVSGSGWKVPATPGATSLIFDVGFARYPGASTERSAVIYNQGALPSTMDGMKSWTLDGYLTPSSGTSNRDMSSILSGLDLSQEFYVAVVPAKWYDGTGGDYAGSPTQPAVTWDLRSFAIS